MFCDLHTHSTFSDGTFSPTEIVLKAKEIGLDAVALCDHNTVAGLDEFVSAGKKYGVTTVAGIEFSTEYNSKQLHIVGLFIKKENTPAGPRAAVRSRVYPCRVANGARKPAAGAHQP